MREYVPGDRVDARWNQELGTGIVEMVLWTCVLVGFEPGGGPYYEAFDAGELELSLPLRVPR